MARKSKSTCRSHQKMTSDECELLIWGVPRVLRRRFKLACMRNDSTMKQTILRFMARYANGVAS